MSEAAVPATASAISALASESLLFDRLKKIRDLIETAKGIGIDWSAVGDFGKAVKDAIGVEGFPNQVKAWLHALEVGATITATTADDAVVATLKKFSESQLAGIIVEIVGNFLGKLQAQAAATAQATAEALAIPWTLLLSVAKIIYDLIQSFSKS